MHHPLQIAKRQRGIDQEQPWKALESPTGLVFFHLRMARFSFPLKNISDMSGDMDEFPNHHNGSIAPRCLIFWLSVFLRKLKRIRSTRLFGPVHSLDMFFRGMKANKPDKPKNASNAGLLNLVWDFHLQTAWKNRVPSSFQALLHPTSLVKKQRNRRGTQKSLSAVCVNPED